MSHARIPNGIYVCTYDKIMYMFLNFNHNTGEMLWQTKKKLRGFYCQQVPYIPSPRVLAVSLFE